MYATLGLLEELLMTTDAPKKRKTNYLNNKDMLAEVKASLDQDSPTPKLSRMWMLLVKRYSSRVNFSGYTYRDDMEAYALYMICRTWKSFNPERSSNPFAFFTQCIKHSFYQFLNKEKRQRDIRDELLVYSGLNPSHTYLADYEHNQHEANNDVDSEGGDVTLTHGESNATSDVEA